MKEKELLNQLDSFELEQMLHAYNAICSIIKEHENGKNRYNNTMYQEALIANNLVFNEIIRRETDEKK